MSRVPIRLRITLAATATLLAGLTLIGTLLYRELRDGLDGGIAQSLEGRADDLTTLTRDAGSGSIVLRSGPYTDPGESVAQLVDRSGRIVAASPAVVAHDLLQGPLLAAAGRGRVERTIRLPGVEERVRILAFPLSTNRKLIGIVGAGLGDRDDQLAQVRRLLAIVGALALALGAALAYLVARASLRPVEQMRRRAETIQAGRRGERLPVADGDDELARLGRTLNGMIGRLEDAIERESRFVADASHELRSPLARLKTGLELALEAPDDRPGLEAAIRSAGEEVDRLAMLADDLLVLARHDPAASQRALHRPVNVAALLETTAGRFADAAARAGRSLATRCEPPTLELVGDRSLLEIALANLVDNALTHGAGPVEIRAIVDPTGATVVAVEDAGPGLPAAFLAHAFDRFSRADTARSVSGAGLGLAIVAAVAEAHGGTATAANRAPSGLAVQLRLPGVATGQPDAAGRSAHSRASIA